MTFLLDTNVISELRKPKPHGALSAWYAAHPHEAYAISSVTLFELQAGAEITRRQDAAKAEEIERWIDRIIRFTQVLELSGLAAREAARLMHGRSPELLEDALIASTAKAYGLIVATRNTRDFKHFDVPMTDPFLHKRS